jgi:uncharacterized protein (DUF2249 family)
LRGINKVNDSNSSASCLSSGKEAPSSMGQDSSHHDSVRDPSWATDRLQAVADNARLSVKERTLMCSCNVAETIIDVRQIVPRMRHPLIFDTFDQLQPGESFLLVNDHDPRPLLYQFGVRCSGQFDWDYVVKGPNLWQVRISREAA